MLSVLCIVMGAQTLVMVCHIPAVDGTGFDLLYIYIFLTAEVNLTENTVESLYTLCDLVLRC